MSAGHSKQQVLLLTVILLKTVIENSLALTRTADTTLLSCRPHYSSFLQHLLTIFTSASRHHCGSYDCSKSPSMKKHQCFFSSVTTGNDCNHPGPTSAPLLPSSSRILTVDIPSSMSLARQHNLVSWKILGQVIPILCDTGHSNRAG